MDVTRFNAPVRGKDAPGEDHPQAETTWRALKAAATTDLEALLGAPNGAEDLNEPPPPRARTPPQQQNNGRRAASALPGSRPARAEPVPASPSPVPSPSSPPALPPGAQPAWLAMGQELIVEEARLSQQHLQLSQPEFQPDSPVLQRGAKFTFSTDSLDCGRAAAPRPDDLVLLPFVSPDDEMVLHDSDGDGEEAAAAGLGEQEDQVLTDEAQQSQPVRNPTFLCELLVHRSLDSSCGDHYPAAGTSLR